MRAWSGEGQAGSRHGVPKTETKVVGGQDTWWKVLEGAWVVGMRGSEFRCCTECNIDYQEEIAQIEGITPGATL